MNALFSTGVLTSCKNLLPLVSPSLNEVISRNVQFSAMVTKRKKLKDQWPFVPMKWAGGWKYHGFEYYPRYPDQVDPHWERTPLFMVRRRKKCRGQTRDIKRILRDFRIEQNFHDVAIVINCEQLNLKLWRIKHMVDIIPITFPDGIPEEKDLDSCRLLPNGELRFSPTFKIDAEKMKLTEQFQESLNRIDKETIQRYTRLQWLSGFRLLKDY